MKTHDFKAVFGSDVERTRGAMHYARLGRLAYFLAALATDVSESCEASPRLLNVEGYCVSLFGRADASCQYKRFDSLSLRIALEFAHCPRSSS